MRALPTVDLYEDDLSFHESSIDEEASRRQENRNRNLSPAPNSADPVTTASIQPTGNYWDLFSLGICLTASNLCFGWTPALVKGFWPAFFGNIVTSAMLISLHLCIAEMISVVPFSGGTYGFARVTAGPFLGFLVGCYECMGNVIFSIIEMAPLGSLLSYMIHGDRGYEPLYWLGFYLLILINEFAGRKYYFRWMRILALIVLVTYILYIGVSISEIQLNNYLPQNSIARSFPGGVVDLVMVLPYTGYFYFGMEMMPLASDEMKHPRKDSPKAIISTIALVTVFSNLFIFFAFCQSPSFVYNDYHFTREHIFALNSGFRNGLGITDRMATIFSYVLLFVSTSIFVYGFGKQLRALGNSKLLPSFFAKSFLPNSTVPTHALLIGCCFGFIILLIAFFMHQTDSYSPMMVNLYSAGLMGTYSIYIIIFFSFIVFRKKYPNLERKFTNPLGILSAVYGMVIAFIMLMIVMIFASVRFEGLKTFVIFTALMSLYYYFHARYRQSFSEEEQKVLFVVYLMKGMNFLFYPLVFL
jgi:ethanolamine permease